MRGAFSRSARARSISFGSGTSGSSVAALEPARTELANTAEPAARLVCSRKRRRVIKGILLNSIEKIFSPLSSSRAAAAYAQCTRVAAFSDAIMRRRAVPGARLEPPQLHKRPPARPCPEILLSGKTRGIVSRSSFCPPLASSHGWPPTGIDGVTGTSEFLPALRGPRYPDEICEPGLRRRASVRYDANQADKKKTCVDKTSSSWEFLAT